MLEGAEVLIDQPMAAKGQRMLQALADTMPPGSVVSDRYQGTHCILVLYGVGSPERRRIWRAHRERGGEVVMWDMGYFDRGEGAMRLAITSLHPTAEQMNRSPALGRRDFVLREDADPAGPVLLVGMGEKSLPLYGLRPLQWERTAVARIRSERPGCDIVYRPKGRPLRSLPGVRRDTGAPIEEALAGASLVVCRHSNVAVDACLAGVPVECEDGAARALYDATPNPTPEQRAAFLARLSWWNWKPEEAEQAWAFIAGNTTC